MKVFLQDTKEVVDVKLGHALNYLIPSGKAYLATDEVLKKFEKEIEEQQKRKSEKYSKLEQMMKDLVGKKIELVEKSNKDGELFGSVSAAKIKKALNIKEKVEIKLKESIKEVGVHPVMVRLGGLSAQVMVEIKSSNGKAS